MPASRLLASLVLAVLLPACATVETGADHVRDFATRHPVMTGVAAAVVIGGTVAALDHHGHHDDTVSGRATIPPAPNCMTDPQACR